ncbi:hypothetical protein [Aquabacterium sp.]|jgi:hypothetical protein|uniref:hypothetical protein n=1 Tax=Aquabacterium TaxID=92793 RepID=UPI001DC2E13E|nr:hypothetical protein [Aquabacterium sp.]MBT9610732.1 hypothetical protein [Aquabacterium sp.]|tara:strand:- start:878 stop:1534 length:657 start_codon:yes stop_codon:yes gene_type:complete
MRHIRAMVACALSLAAASSFADGFETPSTRNSWRPFVGLGFTSGGDTLLKVNLVPRGGNGTTYREDVSSGGGIDLRIGFSRRLGELPLTLQLSGAYHNDQVNGIEGEKIRFRRMPIEATLLWHATDRTRIGFGVRKATRPVFKLDNVKFDVDGQRVTASGQASLKASTGFIVEAEYALTPSWGLKGRYVFESYRYREDPQGEKFEANHLGVMSLWYFD